MKQNERAENEKKVSFEDVAREERLLLDRKREEVFGNHLDVEDLADGGKAIDGGTEPPQLPKGVTVGLALSGGGIRSATFSLGVLQVLARMKFWNHPDKEEQDEDENVAKGTSMLDRVDYLSTVSGGGYIGSWLAAAYLRCKGALRPAGSAEGQCFSGPSPQFLGETSKELHHLRAHSSYLAPEGGAMKPDAWTMATIWARNTLLIQLPIWSCIISLLLVKRLGAEAFVWLAEKVDKGQGVWWWWGAVVVGVAALLIGMWNAAREIGRYKAGNLSEAWRQREVVWGVVVPFMFSTWCLGFALWVAYFIKGESSVGKELVWIPRELLSDGERLTRMLMIAGVVGVVGALIPYFNFDRTRWLRRLWLTACAFVSAAGITLGVLKGLDVMFVKVGKPSEQTATWSAKAELKSARSVEPDGTQVNLSLQAAFAAKIAKHATKAAVPATDDWHGLYRNIIRCHLGLWLLAGLLFMATILIGLMGRDMADEVREWLSRLAAWMWIFLVVWLCLHLLALMAPRIAMGLFPFDKMRPWLESRGLQAGAVATWLGTTVMSALAAKNPATGSSTTKPPPLMGLLARFGPYVALGGILVLGSLFTHLIVWQNDPLTAVFSWQTSRRTLICLAIALVSSWFFLRRIDLNEFSMNHFYRNRLVRCYLGASRVVVAGKARSPHLFTGFDFDDDLPLARFARNPEKSVPLYVGPYPILTAALNSSKGGDLATQERRAEAFVFSPLFSGAEFVRSDETDGMRRGDGYRRTWTYANNQDIHEDPDGTLGRQSGNQERHGLTLGTCMSISGAAVSPNCGYHTSPVTAFLLTIVNARLGWWLPSPWATDGGGRAQPTGTCKWLKPLISELTGTVSTQCPFIYTSDGGHFENLGIYELVRRRCGFIIVVDGEQDGDFHFHGMGTAIRRCRVDFNTEISLDLSALRTETAAGHRKGHCAVGRIIYPKQGGQPRSVGVIVYLKSSLTGDEPEDVRQYRTQSPEFPHETTGDQFFSESQFESYRRLGEHVAKEALEMVWNTADRRPEGIPDFADDLLGASRHPDPVEDMQKLGA